MEKSKNKIASIILAAGKGTRMRSDHLNKVSLLLEGIPIIVHAIETYERRGIGPHVIVVGPMAEQVMHSTVGLKSNLFFCYQPEQIGTGNATKIAANLLCEMDYSDDVFVVAGDKIIEENILKKLINTFYKQESDLAFLVDASRRLPDAGHVVYSKENKPLGIVEELDLAKIKLLLNFKRLTKDRQISAKVAESLILTHINDEKKAPLVLGSVWDSIKDGYPVTKELMNKNFLEDDFYLHIGGKQILNKNLKNTHHSNLSVYLFKAESLYYALNKLSSDNVQQEEYLTDAVGILAAKDSKLNTVQIEQPNQVMTYNTPEELENIRKRFALKTKIKIYEAK